MAGAQFVPDNPARETDYSPDPSVAAALDKAANVADEPDIYIQQVMSNYHVPGVAAAIFNGDQILWTGAYGYANFEENTPVADTTSFMLASISKTVTGTALMQLWENGMFDLDDPINNYLPFVVYNPNHPGQEMTFRQLLTHTSSLKDNWSVMYYYPGDSPIPLAEYCEEYFTPGGAYYSAYSNFYTWAPEQGWSYCNNAIVLVGYLVEAITGVDFDQYCRDSIFTPLGLTHTSWFLEGMDTSNVAMPYSYSGGTYVPYGHFGYSDWPAGQLRSSAVDLARHIMAYLKNGQYDGIRILDSATVEEMLTIHFPALRGDQGLIWFHAYDGDRWYWQHGGGDQGVSTLASFCPDENKGVIVLTNTARAAATGLIHGWLYDYSMQDIILIDSDITDDLNGDGDGVPEAGETVQMTATFTNLFADTVTDVRIDLTSDDAALNIITPTAFLGNIAPNDSADNQGQPFEFAIPADYESRIDSFFIEITWDGGVGRDTIAISKTIGQISILLVDDDYNRTYEGYYAGSLERLRIPWDMYPSSLLPGYEDLAGYNVVIWFTGDDRTDLLDESEITALTSYLDAGGNLFITGQGIAAQLDGLDPAFLHDYLKAEYLSASLIPVLTAHEGGQVFDITDTIAIHGSGGASNQTAPDHIAAINDGVSEFIYLAQTDPGAVSFTGSYRSVFFSFGFEAIVTGDSRWTDRDRILTEILEFFNYQLPGTPIIPSVSPGDPEHLTDHTPQISWEYGIPDYQQDMYHLQVGDDNDWTAAEMWDHGPVSGTENSVIYTGAELIDGQTYHYRVRVHNGDSWSLWYYGRMRLNSRPSVPTGLSPDNMDEIDTTPPSLSHNNSEDNEGDVLSYSYEVYDDSLMSLLVSQASDYPQGTGGITAWEVSSVLPDGEDYFWRVRAGDGFEYGDWSSLASFYIKTQFICGDASGDDLVDVGDAVCLINYIFKNGPAPDPLETGDTNADGLCNIGDAVFLVNYIFRGGPEPVCP
jgi:CubicO group peptidase (beta-lactamase class C family)